MSALFLYLAAAAVIVVLWHRRVQAIPRAAAIVLVILPLLFTGRAMLTGRVYAPVDLLYLDGPHDDFRGDYGIKRIHNGMTGDPFAQFVPWQKAVRDAWNRHEWPLWNPTLLAGTPLAAELQSAPYDPLNVLGLLLPLDLMFGFEASMTLFLAALFAYAFAREIGSSERAALIAAAGYALSSAMAFTLGWAPHTRTWALLPLILLIVRRLVRHPDIRAGAALMLTLAVMVLAGHPESMLHVVGTGVAYALFELAYTRATALRAIGIACAAGILALLLTAFSLMPFLDALRQTVEFATRQGQAYLPVEIHPALIARHAAAAFVPWYGGSIQSGHMNDDWDTGNARVGSIIFALALAGAIATWRRRETKFFAIAAVFCILAAFEAPPATHILHHIPLFKIALNDRFAFAAALFLSLLAGFALDNATRRTAFICLGALVVLGAVSIAVIPRELHLGIEPKLISESMAIELGALAAIAFLILRKVDAATAFVLVFALLLAQRTGEDGGIYPAIDRRAFYPQIPLISAMKRDVPFRIVGVKGELRPNSAALFGLEDARGYEAMTFEPYVGTFPLWCDGQAVSFNRVSRLDRPFLSFLNVRYAIAHLDTPIPDGWKLVLQDRASRLLENERVLPRVFAPKRIAYVRDPISVENQMSSESDFGNRAWVEITNEEPHEFDNAQATIATTPIRRGYSIEATLDRDGWIVISDCAWNGWRAYVDGRRVSIHMANRAFIGIFVPAGRHSVKVVYLPQAFVAGRAISVGALILVVAALSWRRLRTRRASGRTPPQPLPA
jgi:hypothetical protein